MNRVVPACAGREIGIDETSKCMNKTKTKLEGGYVVITTVIFFLVISLAVIAGVVVPTSNHIKAISGEYKAKQGYIAADTVNEDAYYRLNSGWTLPSTISLPFSSGLLATASVTTAGSDTQVLTTGTNGDTIRYAQTVFRAGDVTAFSYGAQIGTGGLSLTGGGYITGDVYSNGSITSDSSSPYITGSATVANTSVASVNQTNSYTNGTSPVSVIAGQTNASQDVAQSFKVTSTDQLTSIRLYLKKNGSPGNATVRIMPDSSGKPSNSGSLGTGTITASTVTTSFTYVSIPISQIPSLTVGTTYWVVIDVPSNSTSNYYTVAATNNTYSDGIAKSGKWSSSGGSNTWSAVSPANSDLYFDIYLGGVVNTISGASQYNRIRVGTNGSGFAWANQINTSSVGGVAYCQTNTYLYNLSSATKNCDTTRADAEMLDYPITDDDINTWKAIALAGGTITGNYAVDGGTSVSLGPKKIVGNLTVTGGSTLSLTGIVWVTGYINLSGGSVIKLASSYGVEDGMIISDGRIIVTGGAYFRGSGTSGSYMVAMTTSQCPTTGTCSGGEGSNAITIEGGSGSVVGFAPYGTMNLAGGAVINSAVAKRIIVDGGSHINYDSGLTNIDFISSSGGGGGLWNVDSWTEVSQ